MIKETVDAVRVAELEADKTVATARDNAADRRNQIKTKAESYKTESLNRVKREAAAAMAQAEKEAAAYNMDFDKEIDKAVNDLKQKADSREKNAVNAVIHALI